MSGGVSDDIRTLLPTGHTGLLVVTSALSCGLDGHDIKALNDLHNGGLPVEMVLLTPGRKNQVLADDVVSDMGLHMPYRAVAMSDFAEAVDGHFRQLPVTILLKSGQTKMVHAGSIGQAFSFVYSILPTLRKGIEGP